MISRLVEWIRAVDPEVTADDVADALWLAKFTTSDEPEAEIPRSPPPRRTPAHEQSSPPSTEAGEEEVTEPVTVDGPTGAESPALHLPPRHRNLLGDAPGVWTRSPAVPALPDALDLCRALRLLRRKVPSPTARQPDEDATARLIAETGLWVPRTRPVPERWMDLNLVVDDSTSMVVWHRTVAEFRAVLLELGAFADLRVWRFDGDLAASSRPVVRAEASDTPHDPRELIDPRGRQMTLVVSDCVGRAWGNGRVAEVLDQWCEAGPVAVVQVLPQRMWADCLPRTVSVRLRASAAGVPNRDLSVQVRDDDVDLVAAGSPIPLLEIEPRWLASWADLVAGSGGWVNATAVFTGLMRDEVVPDGQAEHHLVERLPPETRLRQFRARASTEAYRLATCLAGAPLSLPVMRLVQSAMLPGSKPSHLAEVFLSGLLKVRDGHDGSGDVEYDFQPGVRDQLLGELPKPDTLTVLSRVSTFVTGRFGSPLDFRALLADDALPDVIPELGQPFAEVAYDVLTRLGGHYAEAADRLRRMAEIARVRDLAQGGKSRYKPPVQSLDSTAVATRPAILDDQPAVMGGVPPRNPHFTGRADLLLALREMLEAGSARTALLPHALHGLGGVGKTQLAVEYVYRYATSYDLVWWISAEDLSSVRRSLVELGARMGIPATGDAKRTIENVLHALRLGTPHRKWLLVFDNSDQPEHLQSYLPYASGHVLITSRNRDWRASASTLEVDVLHRDDSIALLQHRGGDISAGDADRLADRLGDLPLALEQAAAWQAETGMPVRDYLVLLDDRLDLLAQKPSSGYPDSVAATWTVAFESLAAASPAAAQLLELCAFFGPVPLSMQLLRDGRAADLPSPLDETLRDEIRLRRAVREIGRYALARIDPVRDRIEVHRLVQAVVRGRLDQEAQHRAREHVRQILAKANPGKPDERANWPRHEELNPHIYPAAVIFSEDPEVRAIALDQIRYRYAIGDYAISQVLGKAVVTTWRRGWGPDDELTLIASRHWANTLRALGNIAEATALDTDTFDRFRQVWGEDHEHTLATANSVGADLRATGQFEAARALDEDNLRRHRVKWGDDHPLTLRTANNVAVDLRLLGNAHAALELDQDTLRRRQNVYGHDDPSTLFASSNLVRDLLGLGEYAEALRHQERVLPVHRGILGDTHTDILLATRNVVIGLRKTGEYVRSAALAEENFTAFRRTLGDDHEHTLTAMMSYSNALRCVGDFDEARALGESALERYRANYFGPDHPFTLACAINVGITLRHCGELSAARALNERTLSALNATLGEDHPATLCCATGLSNDLHAAGELDRAQELSEDVLRRSRTIRGDGHPYTFACAVNAGHVEEGVRGLERLLGAGHPEVIAAAAGRRADCDIEPSPS